MANFDELKLRQCITKALDGIPVTPSYFCHLVSDIVKELIENYELIDLKNLQKTEQIDVKFEKNVGVLHTHIWDNETPNRLYSHSHSRGDIPHGHHGSRYWKVEKTENYSQTLNTKSKQWVLIDKVNGKILSHSDTQFKDIPIAVKEK